MCSIDICSARLCIYVVQSPEYFWDIHVLRVPSICQWQERTVNLPDLWQKTEIIQFKKSVVLTYLPHTKEFTHEQINSQCLLWLISWPFITTWLAISASNASQLMDVTGRDLPANLTTSWHKQMYVPVEIEEKCKLMPYSLPLICSSTSKSYRFLKI